MATTEHQASSPADPKDFHYGVPDALIDPNEADLVGVDDDNTGWGPTPEKGL